MTYKETLYQKEDKNLPDFTPKRPEYKYFQGVYKSASSVSPLKAWWDREQKSRSQKEINEIDIIQIKNFEKNFENEWTKRISSNKKLFDDFLSALKKNDKANMEKHWASINELESDT